MMTLTGWRRGGGGRHALRAHPGGAPEEHLAVFRAFAEALERVIGPARKTGEAARVRRTGGVG